MGRGADRGSGVVRAQQGLVRWDNWHTAGAFLLVALLIASIDWDRRSALVPLSILAVSAVAAVGIEPLRLVRPV